MQLLKKIHIGKFLLLVVLLSFSTTKAQHLISPPYFYYDGTNTIQGKMVTGLPNQYLTIDASGKNLKFIDALTATPFNLATTTNDAGNNKTTAIWRSGAIGIGTNNPLTTLHVNNSLAATNTVNANAQVFRMMRSRNDGVKWENIAQFNLGSYAVITSPSTNATSRLDLAMNDGDGVATSNVMTWQANGNVGVNTTAPSAPLVVQGVTGNGVLKLIAPSVSAGDNWWMGFGHGTTSTDANDRARIGVDIASGGAGRLFFTTGAPASQTRAMFIDESQRVGIGTNNPTSRLEVNGSATNRVSHDAVSSTTIDFSQSNLARTIVNLSSNPTFTLNGIKDGGTYTLRVTSSATGTAFFSAPGLTSTTFSSPNQGLAAAGDTLYTFMVIGNKVFFYMTTGL